MSVQNPHFIQRKAKGLTWLIRLHIIWPPVLSYYPLSLFPLLTPLYPHWSPCSLNSSGMLLPWGLYTSNLLQEDLLILFPQVAHSHFLTSFKCLTTLPLQSHYLIIQPVPHFVPFLFSIVFITF